MTLVGLALRIYRLGYPELRGDEAFGLLFSAQAIPEIVTQTLHNLEPHPPLDYALLHFWTGIAGNSEWAARFTALFASVLAIPLVFLLGRILDSPQTGVWTAALVALNPFQLWHAQEARMYAISMTLGLAGSVALLLAIHRRRRRYWSAFVLLSALNIYTHYYALFILIAQGLYWLAWWRRRRQWRAWIASQAAILLLYLPWLAVGWRVVTAYHGNGDSPGFAEMMRRWVIAFSVGQTFPADGAVYAMVVFLIVFHVGLVYLARRDREGEVFLILYLSVPILAVWLASLQRPVFNERYLIAASPPFYLLVGLGLVGLPRLLGRWARTVSVAFALGLVGLSLYPTYNYFFDPEHTRNRGWRELAARLEESTRPGDVIIENYPDPTLWYYYKGDIPHRLVPASRPLDEEQTIATLHELGQSYGRVWLVPRKSADWDVDGFVTTWLDRHWERVSEEEVGSFSLRLYLPPRVSSATAQESDAVWGDQIALRAYRLEPRGGDGAAMKPGEALHLTLVWEARSVVEANYTVFAHLLGPHGEIVAQRDSPPLRGTYPTSAWEPGTPVVDRYVIIVPADAEPGSYTLVLGLYEADSGRRLPVRSNAELADHYVLTQELRVRE